MQMVSPSFDGYRQLNAGRISQRLLVAPALNNRVLVPDDHFFVGPVDDRLDLGGLGAEFG
jgi:hypothetical protein